MGKDNMTVSGNTTLSGLPVGAHNLTVYAWDAFGNVGASQTVAFSVVSSASEPLPIIIAITASVACVAVSAVILLIYFKKRRKTLPAARNDLASVIS
jgi:multisubunit Na+/H+ antiporter MnhC subunit